jgi:hypothetical protein
VKRLLLGAAVALAAAVPATPASAAWSVEVQRCYATAFYPCGVCVYTSVISDCTRG